MITDYKGSMSVTVGRQQDGNDQLVLHWDTKNKSQVFTRDRYFVPMQLTGGLCCEHVFLAQKVAGQQRP